MRRCVDYKPGEKKGAWRHVIDCFSVMLLLWVDQPPTTQVVWSLAGVGVVGKVHRSGDGLTAAEGFRASCDEGGVARVRHDH